MFRKFFDEDWLGFVHKKKPKNLRYESSTLTSGTVGPPHLSNLLGVHFITVAMFSEMAHDFMSTRGLQSADN